VGDVDDSGEQAVASQQMTYRLAAAFYRAWQEGRPVVGTEYVFEELVACMPSLRRGLEVDSLRDEPSARRRLRAGLRDLQSPEVAWSDDVDLLAATPRLDFEVSAVLRETAWKARRRMMVRRKPAVPAPVWSVGVRTAVRKALMYAHHVGVRHAHGMHLLVGILEDPQGGAAELVTRLGVDPGKLLRRLPVTAGIRSDGMPVAPAAVALTIVGVLTTPRSSALRVLARLLRAVSRAHLHTSVFPVALMHESVRQAVRVGSADVGQAQLIPAMCAVDEQLRDTGRSLADPWVEHNCGGRILSAWGISSAASARRSVRFRQGEVPPRQRWRWRTTRGDPPYGADVTRTVERAERYAAELGHPYVGTNHLLMALLSDPSLPG